MIGDVFAQTFAQLLVSGAVVFLVLVLLGLVGVGSASHDPEEGE